MVSSGPIKTSYFARGARLCRKRRGRAKRDAPAGPGMTCQGAWGDRRPSWPIEVTFRGRREGLQPAPIASGTDLERVVFYWAEKAETTKLFFSACRHLRSGVPLC